MNNKIILSLIVFVLVGSGLLYFSLSTEPLPLSAQQDSESQKVVEIQNAEPVKEAKKDQESSEEVVEDDDRMPPFALISAMNNEVVRSEDFEGDALLLAFFATWCPPCRLETPDLVKLQKEYGDQGFSVIGLSMDLGNPELVKAYIDEFAINYPVLMTDQEIIRNYGGVYIIPTSFLVDKKGRVVKMYTGVASYATLVNDLKAVL